MQAANSGGFDFVLLHPEYRSTAIFRRSSQVFGVHGSVKHGLKNTSNTRRARKFTGARVSVRPLWLLHACHLHTGSHKHAALFLLARF